MTAAGGSPSLMNSLVNVIPGTHMNKLSAAIAGEGDDIGLCPRCRMPPGLIRSVDPQSPENAQGRFRGNAGFPAPTCLPSRTSGTKKGSFPSLFPCLVPDGSGYEKSPA